MKYFISIFVLFFIVSCAKKGQPDGGPKDEEAPMLVLAKPAYKTTNFKQDEIRLSFNEYIVLKDLTKQLVVSPPLKNSLVITPQGLATKYLNIEILDTLKQNTTYTLNFGDAVQDNNENNKIENFKYIFSTGDYIDSLTTTGIVTDALEGKLKKNVNVVLYALDSAYTDSTFYKQKPTYVTNTSDSLRFEFTNVKKGKYVMMALDEATRDYIFNPKTDKVGFFIDTIQLPRDSIINTPINVFKEIQPYKFKKGREVVKGKIQFGFTGKQDNIKATLLSQKPEGFKSFSQLEKDKDTLNYWFTPMELDSLNFIVSNQNFLDTVIVKLKKKKIDSLMVSSSIQGVMNFKDTLFLSTNNPIVNVDKSMFSIEVDSLLIDYELNKKEINKLAFVFDKKPKANYKMLVLPNAIVDLYETTNDTLRYNFATKEKEDYGSIVLKIEKEEGKNIIVQLLSNDKLVETKAIKDVKQVEFTLLEPKKYTIRAIIDDNNNNIWDTGNFLNKTQPEKIVYFPEEIKLRANWTINEIFTVK